MDFVSGGGWGFITAGIVAGLGIVAFLIIGFPLLRRIVDSIFSFYTPSDDSSQITPEYSVAEARVNTGKYPEAIEEYRKVIARHPDDMYPHLRIADIALKHLEDARTAELNLQEALAKNCGTAVQDIMLDLLWLRGLYLQPNYCQPSVCLHIPIRRKYQEPV